MFESFTDFLSFLWPVVAGYFLFIVVPLAGAAYGLSWLFQ